MIGLLSAAIRAYWGAGGTWLLDTVGGSLERLGRAHHATVIIAVWSAAALKLTTALLPALAVNSRRTHLARLLAWIAAAILTIYGAVLTTIGLLEKANLIHSPANADRRALTWHAYLWDPWFLAWGLLIATATLCSQNLTQRNNVPAPSDVAARS
jgi:Protein of unknown function (DUF3995)